MICVLSAPKIDWKRAIRISIIVIIVSSSGTMEIQRYINIIFARPQIPFMTFFYRSNYRDCGKAGRA
ncbi:MAG: hypothetical protein FWD31_04155, partial [Planctomycetaceae bacterium]|nr:hypothetical protein [Planctomycetaceae bacterium]